MQEMLEQLLKQIEMLEKKVEKYFSILKIDNELDFILNGTYITKEEVEKIVEGLN